MSGNRSKSTFFEGAWVTLNADFRGKGASPTKHSWYQSSRVIALSCGIKISAVRHLVLSQSTRVIDRRTDRITTPKTALAYARAVKRKFVGQGVQDTKQNRHTFCGCPSCDLDLVLSLIYESDLNILRM